MTIANTSRKTSAVGTATVGQEVPFLFPILDSDELIVVTRVTATGVENTLVETTNYTVDVDGDVGGTVTMVTAVAATAEIHVIRVTPLTQELDLAQGGAFNAENVEDGFDHAGKQAVELDEYYDRTIHVAVTDDSTYSSNANLTLPDAAERATKYLAFDANGAVVATTTLTTSTSSISTFGETLIDDANASAAQTTLGFGTSVKSLLDDTTISAMQSTLLISTFMKTLIDDITATIARATLEVNVPDEILCYDNEVLCHENSVLTYL